MAPIQDERNSAMRPDSRPKDDYETRRPSPSQLLNMAIYSLRKLRIAEHHTGLCNLPANDFDAIVVILKRNCDKVKQELHQLIDEL